MLCRLCWTKLQIVYRLTGEITYVEVFVAILGASQLTYVQAVESKIKENLIYTTENAFIYFGEVPACLAPDALRSVVTIVRLVTLFFAGRVKAIAHLA